MKKTLLVIMAVLFGLNAMAQTEGGIKVRRPRYVTLGYVLQQDVTLASGEVIKPEFGAMLNRGRTFYLHKKPIANFLNIGIDATWIDMNYAMYKPQTLESALHQAELAVQVGPSFTFTPVKRLQVHLYGRFAPTFALRYDGEIVGGNYASMFVAGGNLSFGFFGVGAERFQLRIIVPYLLFGVTNGRFLIVDFNHQIFCALGIRALFFYDKRVLLFEAFQLRFLRR